LKITIRTELPRTIRCTCTGIISRVLSHNGKALTGSPLVMDTLLAKHMRRGPSHSVPTTRASGCSTATTEPRRNGMDMMIVLDNVSTPYSIGSASGNKPE